MFESGELVQIPLFICEDCCRTIKEGDQVRFKTDFRGTKCMHCNTDYYKYKKFFYHIRASLEILYKNDYNESATAKILKIEQNDIKESLEDLK